MTCSLHVWKDTRESGTWVLADQQPKENYDLEVKGVFITITKALT